MLPPLATSALKVNKMQAATTLVGVFLFGSQFFSTLVQIVEGNCSSFGLETRYPAAA